MRFKSALITGVTGQDGSYLAELLLSKGYEVYGLVRRRATDSFDNIKQILDNKHFHIIYGDLIEFNRITEIIRDYQFDEIYNLAAQSYVPYSWISPIYTASANAIAPLNILESIRIYSDHTKFYQASSSEMFGRLIKEEPQHEFTYHYPRSPYGCAKSFAFNITRNYRESYDLFAVNGILFNHASERRGKEFVTRKITYGVARIYFGLQDYIELGNVDVKRDWGYAPDYVRAMYLMMHYKKPDDWVIATGETNTVRYFAEKAFQNIGIELTWKGKGAKTKAYDQYGNLRVKSSKEYYRPAEVNILRGDARKAKKLLGWKPTVSLEYMIKKMVEHDIEEVRKSLK